ncbi:hypothetical protein F7725_021633 [Dissostichus mawsoni]|uniref:Uncharacterized protein n=1 Tax=Dissostichus mawsoni TaxID=36200 RepID=A0A7J5ZBR7_DISMA|nr:hypothetical protein F7725_021633 [Dissostichus mawsoni]
MKGKLLQDFEDISLSTTTLCCWHHFHGDTLSVGESPRCNLQLLDLFTEILLKSKQTVALDSETDLGRTMEGYGHEHFVAEARESQKDYRRIVGETQPHVPTFHPGDVKSLSGKPHMDMDMKLQPRDTAPHASRQD